MKDCVQRISNIIYNNKNDFHLLHFYNILYLFPWLQLIILLFQHDLFQMLSLMLLHSSTIIILYVNLSWYSL